jgi:hypothetical protein
MIRVSESTAATGINPSANTKQVMPEWWASRNNSHSTAHSRHRRPPSAAHCQCRHARAQWPHWHSASVAVGGTLPHGGPSLCIYNSITESALPHWLTHWLTHCLIWAVTWAARDVVPTNAVAGHTLGRLLDSTVLSRHALRPVADS